VNEASALPADERPAQAAPLAILVGEAGLHAPSLCACCLGTANRTAHVSAPGGPSVIVHYCGPCQAHASATRTRALAAALASSALGLGVAALLLISWGSFAVALQVLLTVAIGLVPLLLLLVRFRPEPGHSTRGSAVWWRKSSAGKHFELVATNERWARLVAAEHSLAVQEAPGARPPLPGWLALPLLLLASSTPLAVHALSCHVRVLNRTEEPTSVLVDGRLRGVVPPTSAESPRAGLALSLVAGERQLTLVSRSGRVLADVQAGLRPGVDHLFAVSSSPVCFWLERSSYGRAAAEPSSASPPREALLGQGPLWALPYPVDSWFGPNPEPSSGDLLSSGGERVALRQGRCAVGTEEPAIILPPP
jgi:hypothetical protein